MKFHFFVLATCTTRQNEQTKKWNFVFAFCRLFVFAPWPTRQNEETKKWNSISSFWRLVQRDKTNKRRNEVLFLRSVVCSFSRLDQRDKTKTVFLLFTLRVRQYLFIPSVIFLLPQELCDWVSQSAVRLPFQHEGTDAKPDRSKQPIGKRSGVGGSIYRVVIPTSAKIVIVGLLPLTNFWLDGLHTIPNIRGWSCWETVGFHSVPKSSSKGKGWILSNYYNPCISQGLWGGGVSQPLCSRCSKVRKKRNVLVHV